MSDPGDIVESQPERAFLWELPTEADTLALGASLMEFLQPGMVIDLVGELGAGKTTLVRGLLRAAGVGGPVRSPTYTLVELYTVSRLSFHHFDFYRFSDPDEFLEAGLDEYFDGRAVCLLEWPERARPHVPHADLTIVLEADPAGAGRRARLHAESAMGQQCLTALMGRGGPGPACQPPAGSCGPR